MNKVKLGDIGKVSMCKRILKHQTMEKGDIPFFKISTFGGKANVFISKNVYEKYRNKFSFPKKGDILISAAGTIGKTVIYDGKPAYFQDSNIVWIENDEKKVLNRYLYYFYQTKPWQTTNGSTITRIYNNNLRDITITFPDISTQSAITQILTSLDDKIELNNKINKELENLAKTVYEYWFVQNADKKWEKGKLSDIANITMGQSPDGNSYNEQGEGIIFFQGCTDFGSRFPTIRLYTTKPVRFAEAGDILLSVRAPVGSINFSNKKCCIGRGLAALNSKIGSITHLYYILKDLEMVFNNRNTNGTTFGAITKDDLFSLPVTKPPRDILVQYEKIAKPIFDKQFEIEEESSTLSQLRDFLLPLLMNGQVTVKAIESKTDIIPFKNQENNDQRFKMWLKNQRLAARGEIDLQTLREIFGAMDDDDK